MTDRQIKLGDCGHVIIHGKHTEIHLNPGDAWAIGWTFFTSPDPRQLAHHLLQLEGEARDQLANELADHLTTEIADRVTETKQRFNQIITETTEE